MAEADAGGWFGEAVATFGDRLAAAREAAGMSREDLARRLGVRAGSVAAWEDDRADPRANRLQMLAGMLNVSVGWLLTGQGQGLEGPPAEGPALAPAAAAALADLREVRGDLARLDARIAAAERRLRALLGPAE